MSELVRQRPHCTCERRDTSQRPWARVFHWPDCPYHYARYVPDARDRHRVYDAVTELNQAVCQCDWQSVRELSSQILALLGDAS